MAVLWKLTKRVVIPAGAVVSIPFVVPLMYAADTPVDSGNLVKPKDLPIYDSQTKAGSPTPAKPSEPGVLLQGVSTVRKSVFNSLAKLDESKDLVVQYYEIGKDHTFNAYNYLTAEENVIPRAVAITVGGLSGLLFSARKGVFKKMMYTTTGLVGMSFVCYPKQATQVSQDAYKISKYYVLLAYSKLQESGGTGQHKVEHLPRYAEGTLVPVRPKVSKAKKKTETKREKPAGVEIAGSKDTKLVPAVLPQPPPPPPPPPVPTKPPLVPNYSFVDRMTEQAGRKSHEKGDLGQSNPADRDLYTARNRLL